MAVRRGPARPLVASAAATLLLLAACSLVSGTSELTGGTCARCDGAAPPAAHSLPCGPTTCDVATTWCCTLATAAPTCERACASPQAAALSCYDGRDCSGAQRCCLFRSAFPDDLADRWFSQCLDECKGGTDLLTCAADAATPCPAGRCGASPVARISVCQ